MLRFLPLFCLLLCISLQSFSKEDKKKTEKPYGEAIFDSDQIHEIKLTFLQCEAWDSLLFHKKMRDSLEVKRYLQGNVEVNGKKYFSCGVRIKGESSFDYYPGSKKSFKINFGEFNSKQRLYGLKTINLNNAFKDPTFMREKLYLDFMREQGLPVPRCSYANLWLNGQHLGLYVLVEEINKGFLKRNFQNKSGSFFQGEPNANFEYLGAELPLYYSSYKNKTDRDSSYADLLQVIKSVNHHRLSQEPNMPNLEDIFNVKDCLKIFAITNLFANVDAYNLLHRHNFYLYKNKQTQKFEWLPYDGNYAFCAFSHVFDLRAAQNLSVFYMVEGHDVPLLRCLFEVKEYREFYADYIRSLLKDKFTAERFEYRVDKLALKIRRYVYEDNMKMYSNNDFELNLSKAIGDVEDPGAFIPGLKSFVKNRIVAVKKELKVEGNK